MTNIFLEIGKDDEITLDFSDPYMVKIKIDEVKGSKIFIPSKLIGKDIETLEDFVRRRKNKEMTQEEMFRDLVEDMPKLPKRYIESKNRLRAYEWIKKQVILSDLSFAIGYPSASSYQFTKWRRRTGDFSYERARKLGKIFKCPPTIFYK